MEPNELLQLADDGCPHVDPPLKTLSAEDVAEIQKTMDRFITNAKEKDDAQGKDETRGSGRNGYYPGRGSSPPPGTDGY